MTSLLWSERRRCRNQVLTNRCLGRNPNTRREDLISRSGKSEPWSSALTRNRGPWTKSISSLINNAARNLYFFFLFFSFFFSSRSRLSVDYRCSQPVSYHICRRSSVVAMTTRIADVAIELWTSRRTLTSSTLSNERWNHRRSTYFHARILPFIFAIFWD